VDLNQYLTVVKAIEAFWHNKFTIDTASMTPASRHGRLSLLGKLGLFIMVALVLLASLLFYVQTRHGFRHLIVPLAVKLTGATLEVRDGLLSLLGALEVDGLLYEDPTSGVSFDAERMTLRAVPWSFITEGAPRIDDLELKRANLRIVLRPGPATEPAAMVRLIPVAIERARFEDVTVAVEHGDRRITGKVAAALDRLGPGRAGNITLQTGFLLERDGTPDLSGSIDLTLSVEVGPGGTPIEWSGSNRALVRTGRGSIDPSDPEVVNFKQTLAGRYDGAAQSLRAVSTVTIGRGGAPSLGTAELTALMEGGKRPAVTDVSLTMAGVMGDTLNLWLGEASGARVHAGRFDAKVETHVEGTQTSIRGKVTGSGVRLRLGDQEASPPVDVSLQHVGSFDSATRALAIETLTLTFSDRVKTLLSGALNRQVSLHLDQPGGGTPSSRAGAQPAVWSLKLNQWDIQKLRPWFAILGRDPLQGVAAGRLGGSLHVSMYEQGTIMDVAGRLEGSEVMLRGEGSGRDGLMGPLGIVADWKSRLTGLQLLKLDPLMTSVNLKGKQVASLHATGTWRFADATGITALNGTLKLTELPGETLNPLLGLWSQARIGRAQIDGQAVVAVDQGRVRWKVDVRGQEIQLRLPDATTDAPSLDLLVKQAGEFDPTAQKLRLDRLNVQVVERHRPVVTLSLDQPLTLSLAQGKEGDVSETGESSEPITLGLRVNRLGVRQLHPWVAMAASQALASIRGGSLDADLKVRLSGDHDVAVVGHLDLNEVTVEHGEKHASAPITLSTEVRASVAGRSHLTVDSWAAQALAGKRLLAQAHLAGSADSAGTMDLALDVTASDLSELVERLGLLTERQQGLISGGSLKGDVRLVSAGPQKPLTVKATLRSANLNIRLDKTHQQTRSLALQAEVEVDAARTVAELQRAEIIVESGGARAGTLTASGRWPLAVADTTTPAGALSVTVKEWDSGPFMEFFGILLGCGPGPLPLTAELHVTQEPGGKTLGLQGKETIGPISVAVKGRDPEPATVSLVHDVAQSGDEIRVMALSLTSERSKGRPDRAAVSGSFRRGPRPHLQLHGSLDAFDADWYAALTASPSERSPTGKTFGKPHEAKDDETGLAIPLDLDVDLSIGAVTYRTLEISNGRLVAKGDGDRMQATLEPIGLAGGSVQGIVTVALNGGQSEFGWDAKGNALDLSVLTKATFAEPEPRVTGRGRFTTSGTGRGQGETLLRSLSGTAVFDIADGQFIKSQLFEFLAEQTRIEQFRAVGFRTVHGELKIKDGWAHLNQVRVDGPSVAVEAGGKIGLDGRLDVQVQPKIGPTLSDHVRLPCLNQFMNTVDGFTVLPVAVTVEGTAESPAYGVNVMVSSMVGRHTGALFGTVADLFTACRGGEAAQRVTEEALGTAKKTVNDLIKDLFVGKEGR
jgi:AsmA-like C-terminal region